MLRQQQVTTPPEAVPRRQRLILRNVYDGATDRTSIEGISERVLVDQRTEAKIHEEAFAFEKANQVAVEEALCFGCMRNCTNDDIGRAQACLESLVLESTPEPHNPATKGFKQCADAAIDCPGTE